MATLLVGYDLNKPGQQYSALIDKLKALPNWWHGLDSTWIVQAPMTPAQLRDHLSPYLDRSDELLVVETSQATRPHGADSTLNSPVG